MKKRKVLLTNFNILNYSGSEIDVVTIGNYLVENNYDVDIFTLEYGLPLSKNLNEKIKVVVPNDLSKLEKNYDLIWAHHYPLLDYILFNLKIKAKHIVYISLSSFEPLETLPYYYMDLSIVGALSDEAINTLNEQMTEKRDIILFPNYATSKFFFYKVKEITTIKKICIVSNHVPEELMDFKKIAEKNNLIVDIYGIGNIVKYVDNKLLSKYDIVISIGKTVYYSLSMGKIVYCYDRFGGYGFITSQNIDKCFKKNFSGRDGKKLTGEKIYNDIIGNYKNVNKDLNKLKDYANNTFNFEKNINNVLNMLSNDNKVDCNKLIKKYPFLVIKSKLYVDTFNHKNNIIKLKEAEINSLNSNASKLDEIYNSTSWKITYPIRLLKKIIYKLFKL